jgi:TPR repeat protein
MATTVRSREAARQATVRICDGNGRHIGQGLMLTLDDEGTVVLTCHHVVALLTKQSLHIAMPQTSGELGPPVPARYDRQRSRAAMDAVVLRVDAPGPPERPLLHALNPQKYAGTLPDPADCLGHGQTESFNARIASATKLDLAVDTQGPWPDPPTHYRLPQVFRLSEPSDARPGISGSVVLYDNAVLGLTHFSRPAGPDQQREVYLVPLSAWAEGWPALADLIELLIDPRLRNAATVKPARSVEVGADVPIAGYRPDIYIAPPALGQARELLAKSGGVIVIGRPQSGKTRLALQLLQERPDSLVVIPHDPRPPNVFETSSFAGKDLVLFVDDLHRSALTIDPLEWRRRLEDASGRRCIIICTSRDGEDWKQVEKSGAARLLDVLGRDAQVYCSRAGTKGADQSEADGLKLAQALGISPNRFKERFDGTPGSLTLDLAQMAARYARLRDEPPRGGVSMNRLLDSAKLVYEASQPHLRIAILRKVAEQIRGEGPMSAEAWDALKRRTSEEGFGAFDSSSAEFRTYQPYLEKCVEYDPSPEDIASLGPVLIDAKDGDGLTHLGQALYMRYQNPTAAERCLRAAIDLGNDRATQILGIALASIPGREAEAEASYRDRIKSGDASAYHDLGNLLANRPGREADAERAFRDSITFVPESSSIAYWSLGNLLRRQQGREREAEDAYREAKTRGLFLAHVVLAEMLAARPGQEQEAEQAVSEAIEAIDAQRARLTPNEGGKSPAQSGEILLGGMHGQVLRYRGIVRARQPGLESAAESDFRDAAAAGDHEARHHLAVLLANQPGREKDAEQAFRDAAEAAVPGATGNLGNFLANQSGREDEAEQILRMAIDRGEKHACLTLYGLLAERPGSAGEAERVLTEAINAGAGEEWLGTAYESLGYTIAQQPGREQEAESAFRSAIDAGAEDARMRLGALLEGQPERKKDAEDVYRDAIRHGDRRACWPIGALLFERALDGDPSLDEEVEQAFRTEIDAGETALLAQLGGLIAFQPSRKAEGCDMLQKAVTAGVEGAADLHRMICGESSQSADPQND